MTSSISDKYIKTFSATALAFLKLPEGAVAGYFLYHLIRLISPIVQEAVKGTITLIQGVDIFFKEFGVSMDQLTDLFKDQQAEETIINMTMPIVIPVCLLIVTIIGLMLAVVEAVALLMLRFMKAGASAIKVIHQINLFVCIIQMGLFVYGSINWFRDLFDWKKMNLIEAAAWPILLIVSIIVCIICFIVLMMHLCYHKDIAMAMTTIDYEITEDKPGKLRRTHLSGISFWFALGTLAMIISWYGMIQDQSSAYNAKNILLIEAPQIIIMLKFFAICFCNHNLKHARYGLRS